MSFLSQIFILSPRGDTIIMRDYRRDVPRTAAETFFRKVKFWGLEGEEAPPIFIIEGVNYIHIKMGGLLLCGCTRLNIAPSLAIELLQRCMQVSAHTRTHSLTHSRTHARTHSRTHSLAHAACR